MSVVESPERARTGGTAPGHDPGQGGTPKRRRAGTEGSPGSARVTAETLAQRQRDISVSEFFAKNRHLLGFDNPRKALLTTVKEAVDNSLDACEEAGILPDITVVIEDLSPPPAGGRSAQGEAAEPGAAGAAPQAGKSSRYRVTVIDNGPGIVRRQVENIFGRLLYGSKFHRLKMSRGQQGIGISAAGMYGLITTGRPMVIHTKPRADQPAHHIELAMNTKTNRAEVTADREVDDFPPSRLRAVTPGTRELSAAGAFLSSEAYPTGTSVSIELEGRYQKGRGSVDEFLELTAIANPHARITFVPPARVSEEEPELAGEPRRASGPATRARAGESPAAAPDAGADPRPASPPMTTETSGVTVFPRAVAELPPETKEIQPHPRGVELGVLLQMLKEVQAERATYTVYNFLQDRFCRVSAATASALCERIGVTSRTKAADLDHALAEKLYRELHRAKLPPPPTDCLAPIGVRQMLAGLLKGVRAEFYAAATREPAIYRGRPFQVEAALAFGGDLPADQPARVIRFANRVPLLYQQSACSSFKAVVDTNWRNYDLQHPRDALPVGPLVILIHMASVWVPFTSESKEAIADYDEIRKEMRLALMECGRKLGSYLHRRARMRREGERRDIFQRYIGEISRACHSLSGIDAKALYDALLARAKEHTAIADAQLDEEGRIVKGSAAVGADADEGVIVVESPGAPGAHAAPLVPADAAGVKPGSRAAPAPPTSRTRRRGGEPGAAATGRGSERQSRPTSGGASAPGHAGTIAGARKPKMRLVKGKLVPVDDGPSLF